MKILVIGSFMMDLVARTPRAPLEGETIIGHSFSQFTGGKGANQAVAAARLGADVTMLGKVGEDSFGDAQIWSLKAAGINTNYIMRDSSASSGVGFITLEDNGKNRIIIIPGVNMLFTPTELDNKEGLISDADIIILQFEIPMETVCRAIDLGHKFNKTVILNPAPSARIDKNYLAKLDYLILNEIETRDFTGVSVVDDKSADVAGHKLLDMGCKNVVITMGDKGVLFLNNKEEYYVESIKVNAVDTTAAGDEFIGAFAYGLGNGFNHEQCTRFANAAAAISVTRMGAQPSLPIIDEVKKFITDNDIDVGGIKFEEDRSLK
ncbi:MAG: ribokinase [Thermoanaerobacteraceae bacterium]|nr:ribokinase [Thermoanaerobacteraceae bacterium]